MERWAVVTGASGGIGREIARELAAQGHALVLSARSAQLLNELADALRREHGTRCLVCPVDLGAPGGADKLAAAVAGAGIEPAVLVNNAGFGVYGPLAEADADRIGAMLELNVVALTRLTQLLLPRLLAHGDAHVLNVSSTAAFQPGPGMAAYFASKAYVQSLSEALDAELRGRGVRVTALCPGSTRTGFAARAAGEHSMLFLGRMAEPAAVARRGVAAMRRGRRVVVPGLGNSLLALGARLAPRRLATALAAWLLRERR